MAKAKKPEVKVEEKSVSSTVPNTIDNRERKFVAVAVGTEFYVFNPDGVRVSGPLGELQANELAAKHQVNLK